MTSPLVVALPLIEGETLTGYISRSAKLYETTVRDLCTDLGMRWPYLCSGHDDQVERLAWLINKSPESLRSFTSGKVEIGRFKFGKTVATFGALRRTALRFCPQCVMTALTASGPHSVFQMQEWAVTSLHSCPLHSCALMRLPPSSHAHLAYDFVSRVLEHVDVVKEACQSRKPVLLTSFERYIRCRIYQGPKKDWMAELDLTQIHRLCLNLGAALEGLKVKDMMTLTGPTELRLCQIGFEYFDAGSDGYKAALKRLHRQSSTERPYFSSDMGPFYHWLKEFYDDPVLQPIIDLTCTHIFETYPIQAGREIFNRRAPEQTLLTMNDASKMVGVTAEFLKKIFGRLNGLDEQEAVSRTDVHVDELKKVQAYWDSLLNLEQAASLLNITRDQVKSLQHCGALDTIKISSSLRYVGRKQANNMLKRLNELPGALPGGSVVPLKEFCFLRQVSIVRVVDLWRQGKLDGKVCRGDGEGLHAIEVDWALLSERDLVKLIQDLTLIETANYLRINIAGVRLLRDSGYLESRTLKNPDTNHLKQYITQRSIAEFEMQYATLGQLAHGQGIRPIHLARWLDRRNIPPINCSAGPVRVYHKREVRESQVNFHACAPGDNAGKLC